MNESKENNILLMLEKISIELNETKNQMKEILDELNLTNNKLKSIVDKVVNEKFTSIPPIKVKKLVKKITPISPLSILSPKSLLDETYCYLDLSEERIEKIVEDTYTFKIYVTGLEGLVKWCVVNILTKKGKIIYNYKNDTDLNFTYVNTKGKTIVDNKASNLIKVLKPLLQSKFEDYHRAHIDDYKDSLSIEDIEYEDRIRKKTGIIEEDQKTRLNYRELKFEEDFQELLMTQVPTI